MILAPVGGDVFDPSLKVIAFEGRALTIGFAGGAIPRVASNRLPLKNASAVGAIRGGYFKADPGYAHDVVSDCFAMPARGEIAPAVSGRSEALRALASRRTHGKVILEVGT